MFADRGRPENGGPQNTFRFLKACARHLRSRTNSVAKSLLPKRVYYWILLRFAHCTRYANLPDRRYMEDTLLPAFVLLDQPHILDVGTRWFCAHYKSYFAANGSEYWTMDIDPNVAHKYGSPGRHVTGSVINVDQHFEPAYFDVILLNGIFGYGVNEEHEQSKTLESLRRVIRPNGILLIGWDDDRTDDLVSMVEAQGFRHGNRLGLPSRKQFKDNPHVYDLFTAG